ncbi:MAG: winged helix-turn-helix transcriptional regulator [Candidatus Thermoplasmatota archaeon]|nr:winged helix-turn-helix transcriptional regulator [Candidatus Thermoplasmatota archaeon]
MAEDLEPSVDQIKVLSNSSRLQIMALLLEEEKTISELAEEIGITPQTTHHHVHQLLDSGLIHVCREETEGNIVKRYYGVEEEWLDSSSVWDELTLEEKKNYKLAALGTIKGRVNRGIRYIQERESIDHEVGWVSFKKIPFTEDKMDEVNKIFKETIEKLEDLKEEDEENEEEITVLISTLPG